MCRAIRIAPGATGPLTMVDLDHLHCVIHRGGTIGRVGAGAAAATFAGDIVGAYGSCRQR